MFSSSPELVKQSFSIYQLIAASCLVDHCCFLIAVKKLFAASGQSVFLGDSIFGLTYHCEKGLFPD